MSDLKVDNEYFILFLSNFSDEKLRVGIGGIFCMVFLIDDSKWNVVDHTKDYVKVVFWIFVF
jgi:hypothetical protein